MVDKPDLPHQHWSAAAPAACAGQCGCGCGGGGSCSRHAPRAEGQRPCRRCAKEAALRSYEGPTLFAVPGNHDYLDGLASFQKNILARGWLGGWLMPQARRSDATCRHSLHAWLAPCSSPASLPSPTQTPTRTWLQEKSYFALHLPHGWWVFGFDLALVSGGRQRGVCVCAVAWGRNKASCRAGLAAAALGGVPTAVLTVPAVPAVQEDDIDMCQYRQDAWGRAGAAAQPVLRRTSSVQTGPRVGESTCG